MKNLIWTSVLVTSLLVFVGEAQAGENPAGRTKTGEIGDALEIVLPAVALATSIAKKDGEGTRQFGYGLLTTIGTSYVLKRTISKRRPDGRDDESFPSSHTAVSFHAAGYIHERYGWKWAVPVYLAAGWVGHSRVHDERHDEQDVIAGAVLGYVAARYFTTEYRGVKVSPDVGDGYVGLRLSFTH